MQLLSVIIPCYNEEPNIRDCYQEILKTEDCFRQKEIAFEFW